MRKRSAILALMTLLTNWTLHAAVPSEIVLKDLSGNQKSLDLSNGKPSLLVFFASWCAPCKKEVPELIAYQNNPQRKCTMVGICVDTEPQQGQKFVETHHINYPVLSDPDLAFADQLAVRGTPTLVLVDGHGKVLHTASKFDKKLVALLEQL